MAIDFQRAMATEATKKALQDPKAKEKYDEFVKMSGIDPMKDISYVVVGFSGIAMATVAGRRLHRQSRNTTRPSSGA